MISIEAFVFDLDGTLIDSKHDLASSVQFLQRHYGVRPSSEAEVASFIGDGVIRLIQRALPELRAKALAEALARFKRHYAVHCLEHTRLYAGVAETLERFRTKKMAVVTNKPIRISRRILEGLGILSRFQLVLGGDSLRTKKPDPEAILFALRALNVYPPKASVVIGDSSNDVLAGQAAGTYTCGILSNIGNPRALQSSRPDFILLNSMELMCLFN